MDGAKEIALLIRAAAERGAKHHSPGGYVNGVVRKAHPDLQIQPMTGNLALPDEALGWTRAASSLREELSVDDVVLMVNVNGRYVVMDAYSGTGSEIGSGSGGVADHGALTGLGDDDHTQYALSDGTRGSFASLAAVAAAQADATDAQFDIAVHTAQTTGAHGGIVANTDPRLTDARTPIAHVHGTGDITGLTAFVNGLISNVVAGAPGALDTLDELAAALGDDPNFATTVLTALSGKADKLNIAAYEVPFRNAGTSGEANGSKQVTSDLGTYSLVARDGNNNFKTAAGTDPDHAVNKTQLDGASTADRARANHTGTQPASTIPDFDTQVRTSKIHQMATPTAATPLGGQKFTGAANAGATGEFLAYGQAPLLSTILAKGDIWSGSAASTLTRTAIGADGNLFYASSAAPGGVAWASPTALGLSTPASVAAQISGVGMAMPVGFVVSYAGATLPTGYLYCDGSAVSRTIFADLFAAIGTNHGAGDGSTTFNLPDYRGRVPVGLDNMDNVVGTGGGDAGRLGVANVLGGSGGTETHTLTTGEAAQKAVSVSISDPGHYHQLYGSNGGASGVSFAVTGNTNNDFSYGPMNGSRAHLAYTGISASVAGSNAVSAHNNMQPYTLTNWIIKAQWAESTPAWGNSGARATKTNAQNIATGTDTAVVFDGVDTFDDDALHDPSVNASRVTIKTTGRYVIVGCVAFSANATGDRYAYVAVNGVPIYSSLDVRRASAGYGTHVTTTEILNLNVGDYVEIWCNQSSGGALGLNTTYTSFKMTRVGYQTNPSNPICGTMYLSGAVNHTSAGNWQKAPLNAVHGEKHAGSSALDAANNRFVCQKAGRYRFTGYCGFSGSVGFSGLGGVEIRTSAGNGGPNHFQVPGYFYQAAPDIDIDLAVGQVVELYVYQPSFSAVGYATGVNMTRLQWEFIG